MVSRYIPAARACLKLLGFLICVILVIPAQGTVLLFTKGSLSYHLPFIWHNAVRSIFCIRFEIVGRPQKEHQTLYMSNHLSYLDIPVIASVLKASFVAKSEVEGWALFGFLSKLQQTAFIQRKASEARNVKSQLQNRIAAGESLIIFPEGTSTRGYEVVPFKSSLFALAKGEDTPDLYVQPMTINILEIDGRPPQNKEERDLYAWPREMELELHEHLWRFAKIRGARIQLVFHEPLRAQDFENRKTLAKACYEHVSKGLEPEEKAAA